MIPFSIHFFLKTISGSVFLSASNSFSDLYFLWSSEEECGNNLTTLETITLGPNPFLALSIDYLNDFQMIVKPAIIYFPDEYKNYLGTSSSMLWATEFVSDPNE